jgi:hypothetical protein
MAFVSAAATADDFVVGVAAGWPEAAALSSADVRSLLQDLIEHRVLEIVEDAVPGNS